MGRARGANSALALAFESTYGTAPATGYVKMPFASVTLSGQQPQLDSELLGYGRDPLAPTLDALTVDGNVVAPIDAVALGYWLKGAFGDPTTTGTDPYTHTFASGATTLPSMSIEVGMPEVPYFGMNTGVKVKGFTWQMQRSGLLTTTVDLHAQGETIGTTTGAGTPTSLALRRFGHFNGSISRDGSALANVVTANVTYDNGLDPVPTIRADGMIDGIDEGMAKLTGNITMRFASQAELTNALDNTPVALDLAYSKDADSLTLSADEVRLSRPRREISGPGGVQVTFDWIASKHVTTGLCQVVLVNDQASY